MPYPCFTYFNRFLIFKYPCCLLHVHAKHVHAICSVQSWIHRKLSGTTCPSSYRWWAGHNSCQWYYPIFSPKQLDTKTASVMGKYHCDTKTIWPLCPPISEKLWPSQHWHLSLMCGKCFHFIIYSFYFVELY